MSASDVTDPFAGLTGADRRRALASFRRAARLLIAARAQRERNARVLAELGAVVVAS